MRVALRIGDKTVISQIYAISKGDDLIRKQLCFLLARNRIVLEEEEDEELLDIMCN